MRRLTLLIGALAAFVLASELSFGPLVAADKPAATVNMNGSAFSPESVSITEGQTVQFLNDDDVPHTVTATDKSFDSGNIDAHKSWNYTFKKAGTYVYGCTYHAWMHGTIKVTAASSSATGQGHLSP